METKTKTPPGSAKPARRPRILLLSGVTVFIVAAAFLGFRSKPSQAAPSTYEVKRADFLVSVVEGGTLESVDEVSIRSEMEGTARIIYIVPEGSTVKKGDLLVELDSASAVEAVNQQEINVEKAQFALVQAEQQLEIQKSIVDSEIQAAVLKVEFAESDLDKFTKGEAGQMQRNAQITITNTLENLQIAQERLEWSEKLYKEGFETKGNLDKDRLTVSQTALSLEKAQKELWMVETFDIPKKKRTLESALEEAKENLERVKLQGERRLAQFKADAETQTKTLELSKAKLERERKQLESAKIYAPQDGLVVYGNAGGNHWSNESMIEEGAVVRNRQEIIKLPDITKMKVEVKIHEAHITQIRRGLPAYVVLDALPDQRFRGVVTKVAPLPDSQSRWGNPDLKLYATEVLISDALPDLKPGVSARAEIVITNLTDVISVPIQAVTTRGGKPVVFLASAPGNPVPVDIGMYNTKFIEVVSGLKTGDQVLLAPPLDANGKDLGGGIITAGEKVPTNAIPLPNRQSLDPDRHTGPIAAAPAGGPGPAVVAQASGGPNVLREFPGEARTAGPDGERRKRLEGDSASNTNRAAEFIKRFDSDGDGKLSESEQSRMQEFLSRARERGGERSGKRGPERDSADAKR